MAVHHSADSLARAIEARLVKIAQRAAKATEHVADELFEDAIELTSGTVSYGEMAAEGHPYGTGVSGPGGKTRAKLRARGRRPGLPINRHTVRLQDGFRKIRRNLGTGRFDVTAQYGVENHGVPYAKFVIPKKPDPNSHMFYRGFWEEMAKRRARHVLGLKANFKRTRI